MKGNLTFFMTLILITSATSCAQQKVAEIKVNKEIKEVVVEKNETIAETTHDFIMNSDELTDTQKKKLLVLQSKSHAESVSLKNEIEKTRIVLIQTVLEPKMNEHEYSILKKKITSLEKKRMDNGFKAFSEARNIINPKENVKSNQYYRNLFHEHLQEF